MKHKYTAVISGLCLFLGVGVAGVASVANAGGGGHGCVYSGQIASIDDKSPLLASEDSGKVLDPELLLQLKQEASEVAPENALEPVIHN